MSPGGRVELNAQRLEQLFGRMQTTIAKQLTAHRNRITLAQTQLDTVSPLATLARGYAIVRSAEGHVIRSTANIATGDNIQIQLTDGEFDATITDKSTN
jgi:exodeoxyribonuclease VII large subunit